MAAEATAGLEIFIPLVTFLVSAIIIAVILIALKFPKSISIILAILIAIVFSSYVGTRNFLSNIIPGFAVILVVLFLMMVILGFAGGKLGFGAMPLGIIAIIIFFLFILGAAFFTFYDDIHNYLPGNTADASNPDAARFVDWFYTARIAGAILFIIIAALAAWALLSGVYSYQRLSYYY
jgi:hypothetical protein